MNKSINLKLNRYTLILICFISVSCKEHLLDPTPPGTGQLNVLYLENYLGGGAGNPHAQLQKLLQIVPGDTLKKKFVLHAFHNIKNEFTYGIWPGTHKNQDFDYSQVQILNVRGVTSLPVDSVAFYFGDQQIKMPDISVLDSFVNKHGYEYIILIPEIDTLGSGVPHIVYKIYGDSVLSAPSVFKLIKHPSDSVEVINIIKAKPTGIKTDPSPPAPAN